MKRMQAMCKSLPDLREPNKLRSRALKMGFIYSSAPSLYTREFDDDAVQMYYTTTSDDTTTISDETTTTASTNERIISKYDTTLSDDTITLNEQEMKLKNLNILTAINTGMARHIANEISKAMEFAKTDMAKAEEIKHELADDLKAYQNAALNFIKRKGLLPLDYEQIGLMFKPNHTKKGKKKSSKRPKLRGQRCIDVDKEFGTDDRGVYKIGPNGTEVPIAAIKNINWNLTGPSVTRKVLMLIFDRKTLASHTLTGKPSPAFLALSMPQKDQLDPKKVADIIYLMTTKCRMSGKEVRCAITTKCADENKMFRQREKRPSESPPKTELQVNI